MVNFAKKHWKWLVASVMIPVMMPVLLVFVNWLFSRTNTQEVFNVTSNNQQGGITAGQVFVGDSELPRHLNEKSKQALLSQLAEENNEIDVTFSGNSESHNLALEIKKFLFSEGYNVGDINTVDQTFNNPPVKDVLIEENGRKITVGDK